VSEQIEYRVPDMTCGHCQKAVTEALSPVAGVERVRVDLETKLVTIEGEGLDDAALRSAIAGAGYEAE
jgi:copper chaperone CopZ